MKILLISDNKIFGFGGGSLENKKYFIGLKEYANETGADFKVISLDSNFLAQLVGKSKKTKLRDIGSRLLGHSSYLYFVWKDFEKQVLAFNPEVVVLSRSRYGFIAKQLKKRFPKCKVVCCVDNVELDYVDAYFANNKRTVRSLFALYEKACVSRDEAMALKNADAVNYLTKSNYKRIHKLYNVSTKMEMILPICIENPTYLSKQANIKSIVFIGTLNYGSNLNALSFFIEQVWKPHFNGADYIQLIVGGSNPVKELKTMLNSIDNYTLYEDFEQISDIVPWGSMMIAPIQKGAGMKVKVAETLSMGLMLAGSDEALDGYERAIEHDQLHSIIRANSTDEYKMAIEEYISKSPEELTRIEVQNRALYERFYSYKVSTKKIAQLCKRLEDE